MVSNVRYLPIYKAMTTFDGGQEMVQQLRSVTAVAEDLA